VLHEFLMKDGVYTALDTLPAPGLIREKSKAVLQPPHSKKRRPSSKTRALEGQQGGN
jgi:hypothetical protein